MRRSMTFANKTETNRAIDVPGFRVRELTDSHFRLVMCHRKESCASAAIYHNIKLVRHHHVANDTKRGNMETDGDASSKSTGNIPP